MSELFSEIILECDVTLMIVQVIDFSIKQVHTGVCFLMCINPCRFLIETVPEEEPVSSVSQRTDVTLTATGAKATFDA